MRKRKFASSVVSGNQALEVNSPYLNAAIVIAQGLVQTAVTDPSGLTWEGDDLIGDTIESCSVVHGRVGPDLYSGTAGIGWFLGQVSHLSSSRTYYNTAKKSILFALAQANPPLKSSGLSLFSGATGIALSAVKVGEQLRSVTLRRAGFKLAREIAQIVIDQPAAFEPDLISGLAGIVIGLLAIHHQKGDPILLDASQVACEQLVRKARRHWWGWSWSESSYRDTTPALCGLAHGASGIGWALSEMGWAIGHEGFLTAAQEAFRYERSWFSTDRCAWPDLRDPEAKAVTEGTWPGWMVAWCHGALGIGAVRLRLYEVTKDLTALAEASAAIQAARMLIVQAGAELKRGRMSDVTLCHGLSGAAELFLLAYDILKQEDHLRAARRVGDLCLAILKSNSYRWTFGLRGTQHVPGLFLGLAGIGQTMIGLYDPLKFSSTILPGRVV